MKETIAAISTSLGEGAIGIVRMSGDEAFLIADKIVKLANRKKIVDIKSHTISYAHVINPKTDEIVEEVMLVKMKAPKTYTREDIVETVSYTHLTLPTTPYV